jgi:hypothetical protein
MGVWNGHYACTRITRCACSINLATSNNVHVWDDVPQARRGVLQGKVSRIYFRADAAFCNARGLRVSGSIADSDDLRRVLVAVSTSRLSCKRAGKTRTLTRFGIS